MPKKKDAIAVTEKSKRQGALELLLAQPGVGDIARKFTETELRLELKMPDEETLEMLVDPGRFIEEAKQFVIESDDEYKAAKAASDSLKDEADVVEAGRTGGTKPINSLKAGWDALFMPARKARITASNIYLSKMRAYEKKLEDEDEENKRKQAAEAEAQRQELIRQANEKLRKAASLKGGKKKDQILEEAVSLERAAAMLPTEFGQGQTSVPDLGSGGKQGRWVGKVDDDTEFLEWLWKQPLWQEKIVSYIQAGLNDLAKQVKDNTKIPGFTATKASSYRREAKRKAAKVEPGQVFGTVKK